MTVVVQRADVGVYDGCTMVVRVGYGAPCRGGKSEMREERATGLGVS